MSDKLYREIEEFYDVSSGLWEQIWGEHMHHGYYGRGGTYKMERREAQIYLIEELLEWSKVTENPPKNFIDVGCGIGGSTLYLADKFKAKATGISLSGVQVSRARERAKAAFLEDKVNFQIANALEMPFADNSFDLVWSLESGEHMPDKVKFIAECYRVLQPGGKLILATWCHRETNSWGGELTQDELNHLSEIYRVYHLPYVISLSEYREIALNCGFKNLYSDDWSIGVAPFWNVVIDSALNIEAIRGLIKAGWQTIEAALSLSLMSRGYDRGLIRFGLICGKK